MFRWFVLLLCRLRARRKPWSNRPPTMFVIKLHHASHLHYDLRILHKRKLISWVLPPVGPSLIPGLKRLAVRVGDHDPEYAMTERRIPEGKYGAGPMIVWDVGYCVDITTENGEDISFERALQNGYIEFWLEGFRIRGGFSLERIGETNKWALTKLDDEEANREITPPLEPEPSIISGLTLEEIDRAPYSQRSFADLFPGSEWDDLVASHLQMILRKARRRRTGS